LWGRGKKGGKKSFKLGRCKKVGSQSPIFPRKRDIGASTTMLGVAVDDKGTHRWKRVEKVVVCVLRETGREEKHGRRGGPGLGNSIDAARKKARHRRGLPRWGLQSLMNIGTPRERRGNRNSARVYLAPSGGVRREGEQIGD